MKEEKPIEIVKILPYRGENNEISEGRKTKISFFEDRIEYSLKYTENVKITIGNDDEESEPVDALSYKEEEGVVEKSSIIGIIKYISTNYDEELQPYIVNYVDICCSSNQLTFSTENDKDKDFLYSKLYHWKYGNKKYKETIDDKEEDTRN